MKKIVFTRPDGGVTIRHPASQDMRLGETEDQFIARLIADAKASGKAADEPKAVDAAKVPQDREFRDAWERGTTTTPVKVNLAKAKSIQEGRLRAAKLAKARELIERETAGEDIAAEKAALQAIDEKARLSGANTVAKIKAAWPEGL